MILRSGLGAAKVERTFLQKLVGWGGAEINERNIANCSDANQYWLWRPECWDYSLEDWQDLKAMHAELKPPPMPPTVKPPANLTLPPASRGEAQGTVDDLLDDQMRRWQQQSQTFFESMPDPKPETEGLSPLLIGALIAGGVGLWMVGQN